MNKMNSELLSLSDVSYDFIRESKFESFWSLKCECQDHHAPDFIVLFKMAQMGDLSHCLGAIKSRLLLATVAVEFGLKRVLDC